MNDNKKNETTRIILRLPGPPPPKKPKNVVGILRVSPEAELAVRELAESTGLSYRTVASELITQAAAVCEIVPADSEGR